MGGLSGMVSGLTQLHVQNGSIKENLVEDIVDELYDESSSENDYEVSDKYILEPQISLSDFGNALRFHENTYSEIQTPIEWSLSHNCYIYHPD